MMRDFSVSARSAKARAKTAVPASPPVHLRRQRLHDLLTSGSHGPLTAITAPAGYGKTVLVASWIREEPPERPVAWLSLDPWDNHPATFWSSILDALRGHLPHARQLDPFPDRRLMVSLASELCELAGPVVLALDNTGVITDPVLVSDFQVFLRYSAPGLRLVAMGRRDRLLAPHLYRLTGELTEIGTGALALTLDETAELLDRYGLRCGDEETADLHAETEGWMTGVCLHAIALRNRHLAPPRPAARRAVSEYLRDQALYRQSPLAQSLLLSTCLLDEVEPALADRITGRHDARAILDELVQEHAFVDLVDDQRYRYHPLFRSALEDEASTRYPGLLRRLHSGAAAWFG